MKKCPFCAEDIKTEAVVCKHCGRDLKGGASQVQLVQPKKKTSCLTMGCAVGIGLFVVLFLIGLLSSSFRSPSTDSTARITTTAPPASAASPSVKSGNASHDALAALSEDTRRLWFTKAFRDSGDPCGQVTRTFYQGMEKSAKTAFWNVACSNGPSYSIAVYTDGSTKLLECSVMKAVTSTACFVKF